MKNRIKKYTALFLSLLMLTGILSSCKSEGGTGNTSDKATAEKQEIIFLNFKPEIASVYKEIAAEYEKKTGVKVTVNTAASGEYEQTLKSEIAKSDSPTIFQINGPKGYASWKNYCADLSHTQLYNHLTDKDMAITDGDGVYGIPYVVEGYGIIYNDAIMQKYLGLDGAKVKSVDEIKSFKALSTVVTDMQAKKDQLGIGGVFASTSLKPGEDWRWQTHLANIPIYYEFSENNVNLSSDETKTITFKYADNFKNIFDLYTNNSLTDKKLLGSKVTDDSMAEFALGKCAMVQNGNWAWSQIQGISGNTVKEEDIKFLPIYMGISNEEEQSICVGTENYFAINSKQSDANRKAAEDFLYWLFSDNTGKEFVTKKLGFITPFDTFTDDELPNDPLAKEVTRYMNNNSLDNIPWVFTVFPSQVFKTNFGSALLGYVQGNTTWEDVKKTVVDDWAKES